MAPLNNKVPARIVIVGSSNTDLVIQVDRVPKVGETVIGGRFFTAGGGKGANQAVAAANGGGNVVFIGRIGRDTYGEEVETELARAGIDIAHVARDEKAPSGVALIFAGRDGTNSIAVSSGANQRLCLDDLAKAKRVFRRGNILLAQLEAPLAVVKAAVYSAAKSGMRIILNPAPALPLPDALLRKIDILTPNEHEVEALTGIRVDTAKSASHATEKLRRRGVNTVIITLGSRGVFVAEPHRNTLFPAFKVSPIDTTGAGDVFNGSARPQPPSRLCVWAPKLRLRIASKSTDF